MSRWPVRTLAERFMEKVQVGDGCWEWQGSLNNKGYGKITVLVDGKWAALYAHRVAWFTATGVWPDLQVLHECDNPKCVKFEHLFLGNQLDNVQDCIEKGRFRNGRDTQVVCKRGHDLMGENVYLNAGKRHCRTCRKEWKREKRRATKRSLY